jgi:hypothetical protein
VAGEAVAAADVDETQPISCMKSERWTTCVSKVLTAEVLEIWYVA